MTDTWPTAVAVEGAVLIGDAAGWSDPTVGQGLSVTFRDVHLVADVLTSNQTWTAAMFAPYAAERDERMRRLRFANDTVRLAFDFGEQARAKRLRLSTLFLRQPMRYSPLMPLLLGRWRVPAEAFGNEAWSDLLAA